MIKVLGAETVPYYSRLEGMINKSHLKNSLNQLIPMAEHI